MPHDIIARRKLIAFLCASHLTDAEIAQVVEETITTVREDIATLDDAARTRRTFDPAARSNIYVEAVFCHLLDSAKCDDLQSRIADVLEPEQHPIAKRFRTEVMLLRGKLRSADSENTRLAGALGKIRGVATDAASS